MDRESLVTDVELAHELADLANEVVARFSRPSPRQWSKPDGTLVSEADLAVETVLLRTLRSRRPSDAVLSEEAGGALVATGRCWIVDPIDGTEPFLTGGRDWGTHIALQIDGVLTLAIITRPAERCRWWAVAGRGAWRCPDTDPHSRASRLAVSTTASLRDARVSAFVAAGSALQEAMAERAEWVVDPLGGILALVDGRVDAVIDPAGEAWDHAAQALLVTEAGGSYVDRFGGNRVDAHGATYTNGRLDRQIRSLPILQWP